LDVGDGKEVNHEKCLRSELYKQCIKYLGPVSLLHLISLTMPHFFMHFYLKWYELLLDNLWSILVVYGIA